MDRAGASAVTIGAYDGVHLGHREVIAVVRRRAAQESLRSVVVTFDRHPASIVNPAMAPMLLTDLEQKLELLAETGIDEVNVIEFDAERAKESAEEFVNGVLVNRLHARIVVVGADFHFGHERRGNVSLLESMGAEAGFAVEPVQLVALAGSSDAPPMAPVSSTRIRALIASGDLDAAATLLGRRHEVRGRIGEPPRRVGPASLAFEVPSGILLPPPGSYPAELRMVGPGSSPREARATVLSRDGDGAQRVQLRLASSAGLDRWLAAGRTPTARPSGEEARLTF